MSEGLLPCPKCGGQGIMTEAEGDFYITCKKCGYACKSPNPLAVAHWWNSRAYEQKEGA